jgi:hypothetical protein
MIQQIERTKRQNFLFFAYIYALIYLSHYARSADQETERQRNTPTSTKVVTEGQRAIPSSGNTYRTTGETDGKKNH